MADFNEFLRVNKLKQTQAAEFFGVTQGFISQIATGKRPVPDEFIDKAKSDSRITGIHYLLGISRVDNGNRIVNEDISIEYNLKPKVYESHIPVRVVTSTARAGFAGAYYADEYLEDMPVVMIEADREYKGKYLAFEIDGDSMEPKYNKGDVIICREIPRANWRYKLHYKDWDFVIAHGTQGIMLKEIIDHNVETGDITCHSINSEMHLDFVLNLGEVAYLFNVVEHRRPGKKR